MTISHEHDSDAPLIVASRDGDSHAFGLLVERHQRRVVGHLRRLVNETDAADIGQETFIRAWQRLAFYDARYRFISWLLIIATRLAFNHLRHARIALPTIEDCDAVPHLAAAEYLHSDQVEEARAQVARLELILSGLTPATRTLYELRFRQELSLSELSEHFGVPENTIKVRIHRLRQALKTALEDIHGHH